MKKLLLTLSLILSSSVCLAVPSPNATWKTIFFGGASNFQTIHWDRTIPGRVYVGSDVSGLYISDDNGENWRQSSRSLPCGVPTSLVQSESHPDIFYMACGTIGNGSYVGIAKSIDHAKTWTNPMLQTTWAYERPAFGTSIAVHDTNPNILYAVKPRIPAKTNVTPNIPAVPGNIQKSIDGGLTWTLFAEQGWTTVIPAIFLSEDNTRLYVSRIDPTGPSLIIYDTTSPVLGGEVTMTIASPTLVTKSAHALVTGQPVAFYTTTHTGGQLPTGVVAYTTYYVSVASSSTFYLYDTEAHAITAAGSGVGVGVVNTSGSQSGTHKLTAPLTTLTGPLSTYVYDINSYTLNGTEHICVTAGHRLACTTDHQNFTYSNAVTADPNSLYRLVRIDFAVNGSEVRVFAALYNGTNNGQSSKISYDGGTTWASPANKFTANLLYNPTHERGFTTNGWRRDVEINPNNIDQVMFVGDWGIYRTDDFGANYTNKDQNAANQVVNSIEIAPNGWYFVAGFDFGIVRSKNKGQTWEAIAGSDKVYNNGSNATNQWSGHWWDVQLSGSLADWNSNRGVIVIGVTSWYPRNFIARSADNGETWTRINSTIPQTAMGGGAEGQARLNGLAQCPSNANILAAVVEGGYASCTPYTNCNGGIWISTDKGITWTRSAYGDVKEESTAHKRKAIAFDPTDPTCNKLTFARFNGGAVKTTNRFATFSSYTVSVTGNNPSVPISAVKYAPNSSTVYFTGSGKFLYKDNRGLKQFFGTEQKSTWTELMYFDPEDSDTMFVSTAYAHKDPAIYMTENISAGANATWTDITNGMTGRCGVGDMIIDRINFPTDPQMVVTTRGCGVYSMSLNDDGSEPIDPCDTDCSACGSTNCRSDCHLWSNLTCHSTQEPSACSLSCSSCNSTNCTTSTASTACTGHCCLWTNNSCNATAEPVDPCTTDCASCLDQASCDDDGPDCHFWSNDTCHAEEEPVDPCTLDCASCTGETCLSDKAPGCFKWRDASCHAVAETIDHVPGYSSMKLGVTITGGGAYK